MSVRITALCLVLLAARMVLPGKGKEWLDVPYVQQSRDGCGAAAIAMVMQYWIRTNAHLDSKAADDGHIYELLASPERRGIAGQKLKQYLEQHGFDAHVFRGEGKDLFANLAKGRPVVVCLAPRGTNALLHYVVVTGASDSTILFHDPARGKLMEQRLPGFLRQWESTGYWTLLATPRPGQ